MRPLIPAFPSVQYDASQVKARASGTQNHSGAPSSGSEAPSRPCRDLLVLLACELAATSGFGCYGTYERLRHLLGTRAFERHPKDERKGRTHRVDDNFEEIGNHGGLDRKAREDLLDDAVADLPVRIVQGEVSEPGSEGTPPPGRAAPGGGCESGRRTKCPRGPAER
jgi:hypothetical protein